MEVPVIVEPVTGDGYRAIGTAGLSFGLTAEGTTREEAVAKLGKLVKARVAGGAELRSLQVTAGAHPWSAQAGWLRDDPMLAAWKQAMEEYRRKLDEDPDAL
jgi:hypothetical protein